MSVFPLPRGARSQLTHPPTRHSPILPAGRGAEAIIGVALEGSGGGASASLPSESALARSLGDDEVLELLLDGAEDGGFPASEAQVLASFEALLRGLEGAEDPPAAPQVWDVCVWNM